MVKFSKQLELQLVPEWKSAFCNYWKLKKDLKLIKMEQGEQRGKPHENEGNDTGGGRSRGAEGAEGPSEGTGVLQRLRQVNARVMRRKPRRAALQQEQETIRIHRSSNGTDVHVEVYETELLQPLCANKHEVAFFASVDSELNKVNGFYVAKEAEFALHLEALERQLVSLVSASQAASPDGGSSATSSPTGQSPSSSLLPPADTTLLPALLSRLRNAAPPAAAAAAAEKPHLRLSSPMLCSELSPAKRSSHVLIPPRVLYPHPIMGMGMGMGTGKNKTKLHYARKMLRTAFVEYYRGLGLLKSFSSLNMLAFGKILKKYDKVTGRNASIPYLKALEMSRLNSSDRVAQLMDEVEKLFTQYFAKDDHKKAMMLLRPVQQRVCHTVTYFVGLFTGWSLAFLASFVLLLHFSGSHLSTSNLQHYPEIMYPIYSMLFLVLLHMYMYGWNVYLWRQVRINYPFIFEFAPSTELRNREILLVCTSLTTIVIASMVLHLVMYFGVGTPFNPDFVPFFTIVAFLTILLCPLNICYRSSRLFLLRGIKRIIFSPFYKVVMADFFLADQLTSQVAALRSTQFVACYFFGGYFLNQNIEACGSTKYHQVTYIISFLPYWFRLLQCLRRWVDEGDLTQLANAGKYLSAMIAVGTRLTYQFNPSVAWLMVFIIASSSATLYQMYWDIVMDWGLLQANSRNPWLRDQLILKKKSLYFVSMGVNFILRFAWLQSLSRFQIGRSEHYLFDFLFASLEVFRRGHWNFYRLENEHLNNVGKYRAIKTVPLPFRDDFIGRI